jgi:hypothetical protein
MDDATAVRPHADPSPRSHNTCIISQTLPSGKLDLGLLPHVLTPWTDALSLAQLEGVDDGWLRMAAACGRLRVLDVTNCNLVGGLAKRVLGRIHIHGCKVSTPHIIAPLQPIRHASIKTPRSRVTGCRASPPCAAWRC